MIIPIYTSGTDEIPEWMILELQGKVLLSGKGGMEKIVDPKQAAYMNDGPVYDGIRMGHMTVKPAEGKEDPKVLLQIGHHRVSGTVQELPKPLILIQKAATASLLSASDELGTVPDDDTDGDASAGPTEYQIRAVVRRKFVCNERPQPIVTAAAALKGPAAAP